MTKLVDWRATALGLGVSLLSLFAFDGIANTRAESPQTIKFVVPFPPGGGADALARLLSEEIKNAHATTVIVENRPGAGTIVATESVARAGADGGTVLLVANSFLINPALGKGHYDPLKSFVPLCLLTRSPNVIVVGADSPHRTLADFVEAARAKPRELTLAFQGPSTSQQLGFEKLKHATGVLLTPVPFPGSGAATTALMGGHIASALVNYPSVSELIATGQLKALATASLKRVEFLPETPTVAELGYPNFEEDVWFGAVVPRNTPTKTTNLLMDRIAAAVKAPAVKARLKKMGFTVASRCGDDFSEFLQAQLESYSLIVRTSGMKAE